VNIYIVPAVLYCVWVFDNMMRRIFEPNEEVRAGWWEKHSEGLHNLHCSPNIVSMKNLMMMMG
jgi:hypothetical protein